ncbi:MAG: hypothetical protein ACFE7R_05120, partial [Candidatus Hodarchaeota archaeon]
ANPAGINVDTIRRVNKRYLWYIVSSSAVDSGFCHRELLIFFFLRAWDGMERAKVKNDFTFAVSQILIFLSN